LALELRGDAARDLSRARGRVRVVADALALSGERIGPAPVGPLRAELEGEVGWDAVERRVELRDGKATILGAVAIAVGGEARLGPGIPFALDARADGVDFAAAVGALPPALAPPREAPRPSGTFDAHLALSGPLLAPAAWTIDAGLDLARLRETARRAPPVALRAPFVHRPEVEHGRPPAIVVGPANPDFVRVTELPAHVIRAVTTSEDAGFFAHEGFDFEELKNAFAQGAQAGHVVRGGSTITQQVAKNLFLTREKTLARKVREAALTIALEASVPKTRLLEIYLNVAEWGPGLWGLGAAARHWFGKDARDLTPREAVFLASVIPNPVRYHFMWERGAPTDAWNQRLDDLLLKMCEQRAIDGDALVAALAEPLAFARPPDALARP
jgi:penicillin-binding protein 1A